VLTLSVSIKTFIVLTRKAGSLNRASINPNRSKAFHNLELKNKEAAMFEAASLYPG
jgi:hypothetical protein